ncbi:MAG: outer membrane beta-barrel protein [Cryomorphaceae bacterium]|nr:porin family protein [Flavobacteriales bacterium]
MKKLIGIFTVAVLFAFVANNTVNAQETFGNAGLELAVPIGDWSEDIYTFGVGGSGGIELGLSDNFAITANAGIVFLALDDGVSDLIKSSFLVPIQVGGRLYLDEQRSGLFLEAKAGIHLASTTTEDIDAGPLGTIEGDNTTETYVSVAPQVGFFLTENMSVALRYQLFFIPEDEEIGQEGDTGSFIGLKAAYNF